MGPIAMANQTQDTEESLEIESWEDLDVNDVLEMRINHEINQLIMPSLEKDNQENSTISQEPVKVTLTGDDAFRSQYVPPEPTVKILKRPTKDAHLGDSKKSLPKKTLQQREQEYAEARLRILGEPVVRSPIEEPRISIAKSKSAETEAMEILRHTKSQSDNVIRLPRGPDGTSGFKIYR